MGAGALGWRKLWLFSLVSLERDLRKALWFYTARLEQRTPSLGRFLHTGTGNFNLPVLRRSFFYTSLVTPWGVFLCFWHEAPGFFGPQI